MGKDNTVMGGTPESRLQGEPKFNTIAPIFNTEKFAAAISTLRAYKNQSLREFCSGIGVSVATISRIENGNMPDVNTLCILIKKLNLDLKKFINEQGEQA